MPDDTHIDLRHRVAALEQMQRGGTITADSREGEFTEFTIWLPSC